MRHHLNHNNHHYNTNNTNTITIVTPPPISIIITQAPHHHSKSTPTNNQKIHLKNIATATDRSPPPQFYNRHHHIHSHRHQQHKHQNCHHHQINVTSLASPTSLPLTTATNITTTIPQTPQKRKKNQIQNLTVIATTTNQDLIFLDLPLFIGDTMATTQIQCIEVASHVQRHSVARARLQCRFKPLCDNNRLLRTFGGGEQRLGDG